VGVVAGWVGVDQVMSSLSNFIVSLALARSGSAESLGAYTLMFSVYVFALAVVRSLVSEPLLSLPPVDGTRVDRHDAAALGATIALSGSIAVAIAAAGALIKRPEFVILAVGFVPLAVQDVYRYRAFRRQAAYRAAAMDTVWVIACAGFWTQLTTGGTAGTARATAVWVLGGVSGLVVGLLVQRCQPAGWRISYDWWRHEARAFGGSLAVSRVFVAGGRQLALVAIAGILGEAALGGLRVGELIVSPILLGLIALNYVLVPSLASRAHRIQGIHALGVSTVTLAGTAVVAATIWLSQDWILETVFAGGVRPSRLIIAAVLTKLLFDATGTGYSTTLKAQRRGGPIALANSLGAVMMLPFTIGAAYWFGIDAAAWSLVLQPAIALIIYVLSYRSSGDRSRSLTQAPSFNQTRAG
jgi:O-antigen/teichoic acid export membrane protein